MDGNRATVNSKAPTGRQIVAPGVSLGNDIHPEAEAPEGRQTRLASDILSPLRG